MDADEAGGQETRGDPQTKAQERCRLGRARCVEELLRVGRAECQQVRERQGRRLRPRREESSSYN